MPQAVTTGATLLCSFGVAPSALVVFPDTNMMLIENKVIHIIPVATIMDHIPLKNIMPFNYCTSSANPMVAEATAAASGVLTPAPCIPVTTAPWVPGLLDNMPTLNNTCKLMCNWGGVISVVNPGWVVPVEC